MHVCRASEVVVVYAKCDSVWSLMFNASAICFFTNQCYKIITFFAKCVPNFTFARGTDTVITAKSDIFHYDDVIMDTIASQITSLAIVYSIVYSSADQRKHQSSASLAFVWGIHRGPVNPPHKWPVTRKMFPFDDVIMSSLFLWLFQIANRFSLIRRQSFLK